MKQRWQHNCENCGKHWHSVIENPVRCQGCQKSYSGDGELVGVTITRPKRPRNARPVPLEVPTLWGSPVWLAWFSTTGNSITLGGFMGCYRTREEAEQASEIRQSAVNVMDRS